VRYLLQPDLRGHGVDASTSALLKILIVGKFPPIEGGVSAHTYWLARAWAAQGHSVHVVTNAGDVEPTLAQLHYGGDRGRLTGRVGAGELRVHLASPVEPSTFIPFAQPHVTRLFGLALRVAEEHGCDAIFGWYFEPYGLVAALLGRAIGKPVVIRHAGSDLGRLARHPDLRAAYGWALRAATGLIVTNESEMEARFGPVRRPRIRVPRSRLPDVFHEPAEPLDLRELVAAAAGWFRATGLPQDLVRKVEALNAKPLAGSAFTIGSYGKVGVTKGSFDLVAALKRLAAGKRTFAFLTLSCGRVETLRAYYDAILGARALAARTWILPPVAPWRIPSFLRRCDAVCFLERDFPIPFHGPLVPREVLSSGACLVCSGEIAAKPAFRSNLVDERNAVVITDPKDHRALARRLGRLIADRERTRSMGGQGRRLARFWDEELDSFDDAARTFAAALRRL
jgi:glycosyltransferase involved in cell wall biosynthesis